MKQKQRDSKNEEEEDDEEEEETIHDTYVLGHFSSLVILRGSFQVRSLKKETSKLE